MHDLLHDCHCVRRPGPASAVFFVGGLLLLSVGILGEYVGRVYDEVRSRPLSLISEVHRPQVTIETEGGSIDVSIGSYGFPNGNLGSEAAVASQGQDSTRAA